MSPETARKLRIITHEVRNLNGVELVPIEDAVHHPTKEGQFRVIPSMEGFFRQWYGRKAASTIEKCFNPDDGSLNLDFVQDIANYIQDQLVRGVPSAADLEKLPRLKALL